MHQRIKVHYGEILFEKCITSKSIVAVDKIAINSSEGWGRFGKLLKG
jgi:hypothetical protein